jgi:CubicO group peptidase (beta-lactamase class C family)
VQRARQERAVATRVAEPLQVLRRPYAAPCQEFDPVEPAAQGYLVKPYVEAVWDEAPVETGAWIAAGQLWGTVRDLCRWAAFLAEPDESVLAKRTVDEMRTVQSISDHVRWTQGYGLGLALTRDGERIVVGHGGAMPGFIAFLGVSPADRIGAAVLTNSSTARTSHLGLKLIATTCERWPVPPEPWKVEAPPPAEVERLLGIWYMEGDQVTFRWREGTLEAQFADAPDWSPPATFERGEDGRWRVVSGWEQGEWLRLEGERMGLSGYPIMRTPGTWV